jgi:asparagine synthase (glutamine-hydrolysing)
MCGFVVLARSDGLSADERGATLERMRDALTHRGPDDATTAVVDEWLALGHRRLSVIDVHGSRQPLWNETHTVACVFNGEIYNFVELRARLEALGHRFATRGDGEVIVHGYEQWGADVAARLEGMFAFTLVDRAAGLLVAARDRFGIKPLFWTWQTGALLVASELKALLAHPSVPRVADRLALELGAIRMHVPWPLTAFAGVHRLPPGALLTLKRGGAPALSRYAPMLATGTSRPRPARELERQATVELERAVARQMVADVPVGAFLSGGIDSSLVVTLMSRFAGKPVHTFSVRTGDNDESCAAALTAARLGAVHHHVALEELPFDALVALPDLYDEPYAETSALGVLALSRAARQHVKVALSGDAGDEVFGGYDSYRWIRNLQRATAPLPTRLAAPARSWASAQLVARRWPPLARRWLRALSLWGESPRAAQHRLATHVAAADARAAFDSLRLSARVEAAAAPTLDGLGPARQAMAADRLERLPGEMLSKVDVASMSASLEVRVPLLDDALVRFADGIPEEALLDGRRGKLLLRRVLATLLPGPLAWARKRGFAVPVERWLRSPPTHRRMYALLAERRAVIESLTGIDPVPRFGHFLAADQRAQRFANPEQILWLAAVGQWAERFGITAAERSDVEAAPLV